MKIDTSYRTFLKSLPAQLPNNLNVMREEGMLVKLRRHVLDHILSLLGTSPELGVNIQKILRIPHEIDITNGKDILINHPERLLSIYTQEGREYFLRCMSHEEKRLLLLELSPHIPGYTYTRKWMTNFMILFEECGIIKNEDWETLTSVLRISDPVELKKRIALLKKKGMRTAKDFIQSRGFLLCSTGNKKDLEEIVESVTWERREKSPITYDIRHADSLPKLGCCPDHIIPHMDVLIGEGKATYIRLSCGKVIGHIKHDLQKTFLAYADIYDFSGNQIMRRGHLYAFHHGDKIVRKGEGVYEVQNIQVRELKQANIGETDLLLGEHCLQKKMSRLPLLS